jgi:hypothetical protein
LGNAAWIAFALLGALLAAYLGVMIFRRAWAYSPWLLDCPCAAAHERGRVTDV